MGHKYLLFFRFFPIVEDEEIRMEKTVSELLDENPLLRSCRIRQEEAVLVSLQRGQTITDTYQGKNQVCLIVKGTISVFSHSEDGCEMLLTQQHQGDLFGVSNLFLESNLETTLRSKTNSTLLLVAKETVRTHLLADMKAMEGYARFCNEKIQFLLGRLEALTPHSAKARLMSHFLANEKEGIVTIPNKDGLSKSLGIGRSSLYREMDNLETSGLIIAKNPKTYAVEVSALQAALGELT